jgi:hypothetical protein
MDALLAHGVDIEAEESPFYGAFDRRFNEDIWPQCAHTYFQFLVDRGANPLTREKYGENLLSVAASQGWKKEVKIMLQGLDGLKIPLDELQRRLEHAGDEATENGHLDIWPILRRAYWKKRNHGDPAP